MTTARVISEGRMDEISFTGGVPCVSAPAFSVHLEDVPQAQITLFSQVLRLALSQTCTVPETALSV